MKAAKILVVEDEWITAKDIQARLRRLGYRVPAIAASGKQALEKAARTHPDLVLMDIKLRGAMDGLQAAEQLKARFGIPVTYLTAYADDITLARAEPTAPYGYLVKPLDERELHATIRMALYRHRVEKQAAEANRLLHEVNEALLELTPSEERALRLRFGISTPVRGPAAVARSLRTNRARARQATAHALEKLRGTARSMSKR